MFRKDFFKAVRFGIKQSISLSREAKFCSCKRKIKFACVELLLVLAGIILLGLSVIITMPISILIGEIVGIGISLLLWIFLLVIQNSIIKYMVLVSFARTEKIPIEEACKMFKEVEKKIFK